MYVKVCGITHLDDAVAAIAVGVDILGFNLIPSSKRYLPPELARPIVASLRGKVICVAVVANLTPAECIALGARAGLDRFQLHGDEPPEDLEALGPQSYKALRVAEASDVERARAHPGRLILLDAKVEGHLGGTGQRFDWPLVTALARERPLLLAGGLTPENVDEAVRTVQPWGVDVASGVEVSADPRRKDPVRIEAFVRAAHRVAKPHHHLRF